MDRFVARLLLCATLLLPAVGRAQAPASPALEVPDEKALYMEAARVAWQFVDRNYQPTTGLVKAHDTYQFVTLWDVASSLAALYSARELNFLSAAEYRQRMSKALNTLEQATLFDGVAFNKVYDAVSGAAVDRKTNRTSRGYGWSALDMGRLLVWLKIVAVNHTDFAPQIERIVQRLRFDQMIADGYLQGRDLEPNTNQVRRYQEGRLGYEQYAAAGFGLWGHPAGKAADFRANAVPIRVLGVPLYGDKRGGERLTSEPFIMMGLELGWDTPEWRELAWRTLAAQQARYEKTGQVTIVSEDAVPVAPHYFYYYSVYQGGKEFPVGFHGANDLDEPRWISTKAALAWHALLPGPYTWRAVEAVEPARTGSKFSAGVFEKTGKPTGGGNINTAAVILEAAVYYLHGRPLVDRLVSRGLTAAAP